MAHFVKTVRTEWPPETTFAYMADMSHAVEWDPSVVGARREGAGPVQLGCTFDLGVRVAGRRVPLRYEVTGLSPGTVTFTARSPTLVSVDTVTVDRKGDATCVTYDARIRFRGLWRLADPLLALGFRSVAGQAIRGLERRLSEAA